jgi:hypothetical protein
MSEAVLYRLAVTNAHQLPLAVVLCGTSQPGTLGLAAARQLASHGVRTQVQGSLNPRIWRI